MIDEGVTAVLAARATTRNGDDSHTSGTGVRRNERAVREMFPEEMTRLKDLSGGCRPDLLSVVASKSEDHEEAIELASELHGIGE
ncbi:hypothetical protein Tco_0431853 [Tanacetum coccineum]